MPKIRYCSHVAPDSCHDCDGTAADGSDYYAREAEIARAVATAGRNDLARRLHDVLSPEDLQVIRDALIAYSDTLAADLLDGTATGHHRDTLHRTVRRAGNMTALIERASAAEAPQRVSA